MITPDQMLRLKNVADLLVVALFAAAAAIAWTGGGRVEFGGFRLSAGSWSRPLVAAVLLFAATRGRALLRRRTSPADAAQRLATLITAALIVAALMATAAFIIHACGGLDSHGYVAFSELLSRGRISRPLSDLSWLPVDRAADVAAPLGFIPSSDGLKLLPEFPPGLPLLMAGARLLAGPQAVFWVPWLCQACLVAIVFLLSRHRYGTLTGGLAAALMAAHPVAAAYAMQAMSDVPATLATVVAVYATMGRDKPRPLAAGLAGSLAMLIRPPLLLPMVVLCAAGLRRTPRAALVMAVGVLPGLLGLMLLQYQMFGSPLVSGHGSAGRLFTTDAAIHNLTAHGKWFLIVHTPLIVPALWLGWRADRRFGTLMMALAGAVALPYVFYVVPFDDWEMLRFLLPGLALLIPVAAEGVASLLRRLPSPALRQLAVVAVAALALITSGQWLDSHGILALPRFEAKYPRVATWFAQRTPANAVVLASLHSGSVQYYSGRLTLRWDAIPPGRLARTVAAAGARGLPVYAALESYEMPQFERRFAGEIGTEVTFDPLDRIFTTYMAELRPK